jgi:anti-sigma factor RsiW
MQHLDEGTIHSWLDGALSADEAARAEAHVKECPQCAAAVAEARGFIAASSRILTALDNAPRGVIPAAAPRRRVDPMVWRIAATVLVVAAGTLVVFRNGVGTTKTENATAQTDQTAPRASSAGAPETLMRDTGTGTTAAPAPPVSADVRSGSTIRTRALSKPSTMEKGVASGEVGVREQVLNSQKLPAAPPAQTVAQPTGGVAMLEAASDEPRPLKVVGTPRTLGAKVTLYEVAPGDTVTLTEPMPFLQSSVVVTGVAVGKAAAAAAAAPMRRADAAAASAPAASAGAQASRVESANGVTTISWPDPVTGNMLTLSGRMPATRLQEIRLRIERERAAAAAATKKNP